MKMYSVFNQGGDEIRVSADMLEYYASIGWNQVEATKAAKAAPKAEVEAEVVSEEFE